MQIDSSKVKSLRPSSAAERKAFERKHYARHRKDAATVAFTYQKRDIETVNPKPTAAAIRKAVASDTPRQIIEEIRAGVLIMVLCAGNPISIDAPLASQYLAAFQRIADFHGGSLLCTPEEGARFSALVRADWIVRDAITAFKMWKESN